VLDDDKPLQYQAFGITSGHSGLVLGPEWKDSHAGVRFHPYPTYLPLRPFRPCGPTEAHAEFVSSLESAALNDLRPHQKRIRVWN